MEIVVEIETERARRNLDLLRDELRTLNGEASSAGRSLDGAAQAADRLGNEARMAGGAVD